MDKKKLLKSLGKILLSIVLIGIIFLILFIVFYKTTGLSINDLKNKEVVREFIESTGGYGKLVFILLQFLQVTFIPIPGSITIIVGNYLFGFWSTLYMSYIGMLLGSLLAFLIGRKVGRPFVNWVVGDKETVDKYLQSVKDKETILFFLFFLFPFFPDDALCSVAGITNLSWKRFIIIQLITRFTSIIGTLLFMSGDFIPFEGWGIPVLIILGIAFISIIIISYKKADKINALFEKLASKITSIIKK